MQRNGRSPANCTRTFQFPVTAATARTTAFLFVLVLASGCESATRRGEITSSPESRAITLSGPRRVVAIGGFDANGAFLARYGQTDVGGGLAAMLATELVETGQFDVVERARISQVLFEQQLKGQGLTRGETGPQVGELLGADLIVFGSVTDFTQNKKGGGFGIGYSGGRPGSLTGGSLAPQFAEGTVTMDIRVVDATTAEVLASHRVSASVSRLAVNGSFSHNGFSFNANAFRNSPLGEAARQAARKAVYLIAASAERVPWRGRVVEVDAQGVFVNAGSAAGLHVGDRFRVERIVHSFTDPASGDVLGHRYLELCEVRVAALQPKVAYATFASQLQTTPQRGDLLVLLPAPAVALGTHE